MKHIPFIDLIHIDDYAATPKYLQLANSITAAVERGEIGKGDMLPSINELSFVLEISRDTIEKGYKHLRSQGILNSVPGKGYYIGKTDLQTRLKIFLLFNKLSAHKKIIYNSFVNTLGGDASIDFYIYNNDFPLFKKLLTNNNTDYSHYVIIPHFIEGGENAHEIVNTIPKEKLVLLDKLLPGVEGAYAAVYENFEKDIYSALSQALQRLSKYHTLKLIFPDRSYFPKEIITGFQLFCRQYAFNHRVVHDISSEPINEGEVFINLMEEDLVILIERIVSLNLEVGTQVGVISYNETPVKKIILNGITTISTDFQKMGSMAARLILDHSAEQLEVPFYLTVRNSL